jgi:hypothetical protein
MKRVVLPVVCLAVLAWTGFARAEVVTLQIKGAY